MHEPRDSIDAKIPTDPERRQNQESGGVQQGRAKLLFNFAVLDFEEKKRGALS
jgi:hypothetical protein